MSFRQNELKGLKLLLSVENGTNVWPKKKKIKNPFPRQILSAEPWLHFQTINENLISRDCKQYYNYKTIKHSEHSVLYI